MSQVMDSTKSRSLVTYEMGKLSTKPKRRVYSKKKKDWSKFCGKITIIQKSDDDVLIHSAASIPATSTLQKQMMETVDLRRGGPSSRQPDIHLRHNIAATASENTHPIHNRDKLEILGNTALSLSEQPSLSFQVREFGLPQQNGICQQSAYDATTPSGKKLKLNVSDEKFCDTRYAELRSFFRISFNYYYVLWLAFKIFLLSPPFLERYIGPMKMHHIYQLTVRWQSQQTSNLLGGISTSLSFLLLHKEAHFTLSFVNFFSQNLTHRIYQMSGESFISRT